jgi:hypothetical protein
MNSTLDHKLLQKLYNQGKTDQEMSDETGYRKKSISEWRYRHKLPANNKFYAVDDKKAMELWDKCYTDKEIAKELGCGLSSVIRWRELNDLPGNGYLFKWQMELKPSEFAKIPEKYRDPKLCIA